MNYFFKNQPEKQSNRTAKPPDNKAIEQQKMALISDYKRYDTRYRNHSPRHSGYDDRKSKKERFELFLKEVYEFIIEMMLFIVVNIAICLILIFIIYIFLHRHKIDRKYGVV